ncbi:MAG: peptide chain release factor N(5)-glutamine methyltransferase [Paracoccus sp. (in: a-proteobacteria)]|nr:peptide chain release factor N(5)-glutamine methyltransferase [Paracoccus sp. (in: a-proteobacteria)]
MTGSEPTIRTALDQAAQTLGAAGVDDPAGDARRLMAAALRASPALLATRMGERLSPEEAARFAGLLARRARRQPASQIIGRRAFWAHDFRVTQDVLDPRPETETLIEAALAMGWRSVLDLGTGSGAILISLLAARPGSTGLGVDLSPAAIEIARQNAASIGVRADFLVSDWLSSVTGRFDLIVSNPPYIALSEMEGLAPEVRDWEPRLALTDEGDGLGAYRAIIAGAGAHLVDGGAILLEIGSTQGDAVSALLRAAGFERIAVLPDLDARPRAVRGHLPKTASKTAQ